MKKALRAIVAAVVALALVMGVAGCAPTQKAGDKVQITMCLWDKSMTKKLTPWLEQKFPEYDFTFLVGYNTMDYYKHLDEVAELPDILTCRRFSINDAAKLSDKLLDLSETNLAGSFYASYIENNRETDGAIRWLPMCAEVDGYIANIDLFEDNGIAIPTTYKEFIEAKKMFEKLGIAFFDTDFHADYTCLETMQGCAIPELMSLEGTTWRSQYESEKDGEQVGLDSEVWPKVFEKYERYLKDMGVKPDDADNIWGEVSSAFLSGKVAIMRATANDCDYARNMEDVNAAVLPYYGDTAEDNWLLTYPMCQATVSKAVADDSAKHDAVMEVLEAVFSDEGQKLLASGTSVLSYNKNVDIEPNENLRFVQDCIDSNHMYMRLASTEFFSSSHEVAQGMIKGELNAAQAYKLFNERIISTAAAAPAEVVFTQEEAYPMEFGEHGNPAASAMLNTLREANGTQLAIGYANLVSTPVYAGDYTEQDISWYMAFKAIARKAEYTGAEVRRVMEWLVNVSPDGNNPIRHHNTNIPVTSGMEYTMTDNGDGTFTLGELTIDGQPLDDNAVYQVLLIGEDGVIEEPIYCNCPMPEDLKAKRVDVVFDSDSNSYTMLIDWARSAGKLEAPTDYVTVTR